MGGSNNPVAKECYKGTAGYLGEDETVEVEVLSMSSTTGTISLVGSGLQGFTCNNIAFTKQSGSQDIDLSSADLSCLPDHIEVSSVKYCSASNKFQVTVKDNSFFIPVSISSDLDTITCPSAVQVATCEGSNNPVASKCYKGTAGYLGEDETVEVDVLSMSSTTGTISLVGSGLQAFTCNNIAFTKQSGSQNIDLSSADLSCLPDHIEVSSVKYCSTSDKFQVTVKDNSFFIPVSIAAELDTLTCPSAVQV